MKIRRPSALTSVTAALILLLAALALLQYRWVGQANEAERDRVERNLRTAALQFQEAFDGEIVSAMNGLRVDLNTVLESAWSRYADRYMTWAEMTEHPDIVAAVFLVDDGQDAARLRRWNVDTHTFDVVEWPANLEPARPQFEEDRLAFLSPLPPRRPPIIDDDSLIVTPANAPFPTGLRQRSPRIFAVTVVQLDMRYIQRRLLPALARRHFAGSEGTGYRFAITDAGDAGRVIYQSDPNAPMDRSRADAALPLYGGFLRGEITGPNYGDQSARDGRRFGRDIARWALLVQHERGSLDAAVTTVRRRNMTISFGILILLTLSIGLLAISSRRAQRIARQQMEFVAGVSHELRTPVAVIRSAAENLSHGVVGSGDRVKQYGEVIETEARRLGEMVERVLHYAGIASKSAPVTRVALAPADIVESAVASAKQALAPATIDCTIPGNLSAVAGDRAALRSALENLIANAVKYGGSDRWVGVTATQADGHHPEVQITVEDHGPGIPADELPHVFEPFYRGAAAVSRQIHGSGLGLALVQQIVAAHGGRVTVASRPGAGSAFTVHLPVHS